MARIGIDMRQTDTCDDEYLAIEAGTYTVEIVESDMVQTRAGDAMLSYQVNVLGPTNHGRRLFGNFCIGHSKDNVRSLAQRQITTLAEACGKRSATDSRELHGIPVNVKIKKIQDAQYGDSNGFKNEINQSSWTSCSGNLAPPTGMQPATPPPVQRQWSQTSAGSATQFDDIENPPF